jgi:ketosteroid isomerase-like protein
MRREAAATHWWGRGERVCRPLLVAIAVVLLPHVSLAQSTSSPDSSFRAFLSTFEAATRDLLNGDGAHWQALLSTEPGATLFNPYGGTFRDTPEVTRRYAWLASQLTPRAATLTVDYLSIDVSGDLATVVSLEHPALRSATGDSIENRLTRATMIFRHEAGGWRLRHRHMDHLGESGAPK